MLDALRNQRNRSNETPPASREVTRNMRSERREWQPESLDAIAEALGRENIIVTGIGSRETDPTSMRLHTLLASSIEERNGRGRSGGAGGSDLAFEKGFKDPRNIDVIFPWKGFLPKGMTQEDVNRFLGRDRISHGPGAPVMLSWEKRSEAEEIAKKYHPKWEACSRGARGLHTRNVPQVLGLDLKTKSDVVVSWTVDGKDTGGTGQAMRIARDMGIPIANLNVPAERKLLCEMLNVRDPAVEMQMHMQSQQGRGW